MLNWIKNIFAPTFSQATPVKTNKRKTGWTQKGHYRTYKSGKKVWIEPK